VQLATRDLHIVEDVVIGREGEHRRLEIVDEQGLQQTVLWWQGADQALPEGRFDLAFVLRARDYRGEMQLQVEWLDARPLEPTTLISPQPALAVVDRRGVADPRAELAKIPETEVVVWAEGDDLSVRSAIGGVDRLGLTPSPVLVIWTSPPGPVELAHAIQAVTPAKIYLFAMEPSTTSVRLFLERLVGMVKHDLSKREGRVNVGRVAAVLGQREMTVRAGLEWLAAKGQVQIVRVDEGTITVQAGGELKGEATELEAAEFRLRHLLQETAAFRRHFRWAPTQALGIFV
jgi:single-stranded-DNA-specific exonuclease